MNYKDKWIEEGYKKGYIEAIKNIQSGGFMSQSQCFHFYKYVLSENEALEYIEIEYLDKEDRDELEVPER